MAQSNAERVRLNLHLTRQHVDGVLLLSLHDEDPLPALLADRDLPVVLGGRTASMLGAPEAAGVSFVDVDNVGGARLATTHLLAAGRQRIATIAGPMDMGAGVARLNGYRDAMTTDRRPIDSSLIAYGDFTEDSGTAAMRALLASHPDIDAVFAANDPMAMGAMRVLRDAGRRVPEDVAVVGFDDSVLANQTQPTLTSVHQPIEEMGRAMVRLLYDKIRGIEPDAHYVILGTHLVLRDSG